MPDIDGSLDSEQVRAGRPAPACPRRSTGFALAAGIFLSVSSAAIASAQQPLVASRTPATPEFFSRFDFHLNAAWLGESAPATAVSAAPSTVKNPLEHRYSFDTHWGGSLDFVDYVVGRTSFIIDYEAILGDELRLFDPNQGIYTLEAATSARAGDLEVVGIFHHVSRHLADRANRQAVAWNAAGVRLLKRVTLDANTVDIDAEWSRTVAKAFVDYTWIGELNLLARHPVSDHVGVYAQGSGKLFAVDGSVANRGTQTGGVAEVGVRLTGTGGALELFAGFEKRIDAYELERDSQRWVLAGFRLLSR